MGELLNAEARGRWSPRAGEWVVEGVRVGAACLPANSASKVTLFAAGAVPAARTQSGDRDALRALLPSPYRVLSSESPLTWLSAIIASPP